MSRLDGLLSWVERLFVEPVERLRLPFWMWVGGLYTVLLMRSVIEGATGALHIIGFTRETITALEETLLHIPSFFIPLLLLISLVTHFTAREGIGTVTKMVFFYSFFILLPPLIDPLFDPRGYRLLYPTELGEMPAMVEYGFNIFNPIAPPGVSPGMRIEWWVGGVLVALYVCLKRRSLLRAVVAAVGVILSMVIVGFLPALLSALTGLSFDEVYYGGAFVTSAPRRWLLLQLLLTTGALIGWFYSYDRAKFRAVVKGLRSGWLLHFLGLALAGLFVGWVRLAGVYTTAFQNPFDYLSILGMVLAILFLTQALSYINSLDLSGLKEIPSQELKVITGVLVVLGLGFGVAVGYTLFLLLLFFLGLGVVYAAPPLRLKRFYPLSVLIIGVASLTVVLAGFSLLTEGRAWLLFPGRLKLLIVCFLLLALGVKDLKDIPGDRARGFTTLSTLLGEARGRWVTGGLVLLAYLLAPLILGYPRLYLVALPLGLVSVIALMGRFKPWPVFGLSWIFGVATLLLLARGEILRDSEFLRLEAYGYFRNGENYYKAVWRDEPRYYRLALREYMRAEELGFDDDWLKFRLGYTHLRLDSFGEGVSKLEEFHKSPYPGYWKYSITALGFGYLHAGQYEEGERLYEEAVARRIELFETYRQLGVHYKRRGRAKDAARYFLKVYKLGEFRDEALRQLGDFYHARRDLRLAEELYYRSLEENPDYTSAMLRLGGLYWEVKEYPKALELYERAAEVEPDNPLIWNNIGMVYAAQNRLDKAVTAFLTALRKDPRFLDAYENLAITYERYGHLWEAARVYEEWLKIDPGSTTARRSLERLRSE